MNNTTLLLGLKLATNKVDSLDYDSIQKWQWIYYVNKAQSDLVRRLLEGNDQKKIGAEGSEREIDDLGVLLIDSPNVALIQGQENQSFSLPDNYMEWCRVSGYAKSECCPARKMKIWLVEEANIDDILRDDLKGPNFLWSETVATSKNNHIYIYNKGEFTMEKVKLTYYRYPANIQITGVMDPYTLQTPTQDVLCEFNDDFTRVIIDEAVKIISGDLADMNRMSIANQSVEANV